MFALLSILFAVSLSAAVVAVGTQILLPGRKFIGKRPFPVLLKKNPPVTLPERRIKLAISSVNFSESKD